MKHIEYNGLPFSMTNFSPEILSRCD